MTTPFTVRRVVTGHDDENNSVFVADEEVGGNSFPGGDVVFLWGREDTARYPDDGSEPEWEGPFPGIGGVRFSYSHFLPGQAEEYDAYVAQAVGEGDEEAGMHRSKTLDLLVLVTGQLRLEVEKGVSTVLNAGDVVVQNGTRHRWTNVGDVPAVLAAVSVGAVNGLVD